MDGIKKKKKKREKGKGKGKGREGKKESKLSKVFLDQQKITKSDKTQ